MSFESVHRSMFAEMNNRLEKIEMSFLSTGRNMEENNDYKNLISIFPNVCLSLFKKSPRPFYESSNIMYRYILFIL